VRVWVLARRKRRAQQKAARRHGASGRQKKADIIRGSRRELASMGWQRAVHLAA
jgi:hypothetical protein